jgi:hypothetical protein
VFCRSLFVLLCLAIILSVLLRCMTTLLSSNFSEHLQWRQWGPMFLCSYYVVCTRLNKCVILVFTMWSFATVNCVYISLSYISIVHFKKYFSFSCFCMFVSTCHVSTMKLCVNIKIGQCYI